MKRLLLFQRFFAAVLLLAVSTLSWANGIAINGIYYVLNSSAKTASVTYTGTTSDYNPSSKAYTGSITIPSTVTYNSTTYSVTSIGSDAFYECTGLTSVTIPNSVTSIGGGAFGDCSGLTSVTIPNSVTKIGKGAFENCSGLTSVTIPNSVTNIGESTFQGCSGLTSVIIPNNVTSIGGDAFGGCSGLTSVIIGNSVTSIGWHAFSGCIGLTSVTIPNSVTEIGLSAFSGCSGLTSVTIGNGVTSIGGDAFINCTSLTSVTIGNSVISIGSDAFLGCEAMKKAEFASIESLCKIGFGNSEANPLSYAQHLYINGQEITNLVIPNSVTGIGWYAFSGCSGLTSVTIGNGVTSIGESAFECCSGLTSATIGNSVTSIGESAFENCTGLTKAEFASIESLCKIEFVSELSNPLYYAQHLYINEQEITDLVIPNSVTSIGRCAFYQCIGLTSVVIPNSVASIGNYAFYYCTGLTSVTIGNSVTSIGTGAFSCCSGLTSVTIPSSVTNIGESTFQGCSGLTSVIIPNNVTSIGGGAFCGCSGLTSVIIPNSVTSIGWEAFEGCSRLTSITIPNSVTSIGRCAFYQCIGLTSVVIPNSVASIEDGAFDGCSGLTKAEFASIESLCRIRFDNDQSNPLYYAGHLYINGYEVKDLVIPNSLTNIGNYSFYGCSGLTSVTIPNSVTSIGEYAFADCSGLASVIIPNSVTSIEKGAFSGCSGLTSVTIPNSVTSIGSYALSGCSRIKNVLCKALNVPATGSSCFRNITLNSATLYVPSIALNDYKATTPWSSFGTILPISDDGTIYNITATANPTNGGSITGAGSYQNGATVTLTATPASGYEFISWTENGTAVSTQLTYAFITMRDRSLVANFQEADEENNEIYYSFNTSNNTATVISGENKYTGDVVIPETVTYQGTTYTVTKIGNSAFAECTDLTSVTIGNGVTSIGQSVFYGCSGLTSVTIGNNVTSIGSGAFASSALISITIPNSVTSIGSNAFSGCSSLTSATIGNGVTSIGECVFSDCSGLTSVTIPEGVTSIEYEAFQYCTSLTSITIPNSVTYIASYAFLGCSNLKEVYCMAEQVPDTNYKTILDKSIIKSATLYVPASAVNAYKSSSYWKEFGTILPIAVENEIYYSFNTSNNTATVISGENQYTGNVVIPETVTYQGTTYTVTSIDNSAFAECAGLTSVTIGNNVRSIGYAAFDGCRNLKSVTFGSNMTIIGSWAFYRCSGLTSVTIPNSVTSVGEGAFSYCSGMTSATIGNNVTSIGNSAFSYCSDLTSVTIGNSVRSIGNSAFVGCSSLPSIDIPNSVTSLAAGTFWGCTSLKSVTVPSSVESIGSDAFSGCYGLASVTLNSDNIVSAAYSSSNNLKTIFGSQVTRYILGNDVTSIGANAFRGSSDLISVTVPNSVTSIGEGAFAECDGLTSVTLNSNNIVSSTYTSSSNLNTVFGSQVIEYIIGDEVTSIGNYAFYSSTGLTSLTIGNGVTSIGDRAFYGCTGLKNVVCRAQRVPTASSNCFGGITLSSATLYVPASSVNSYKSTSPWSDFGTVTSIPDNFQIWGIKVNKSEILLHAQGNPYQLTATVVPEYAANKALTWTSSNTSVATVDANGLITPVNQGMAVITATTKDGTNLSATCTVTVDADNIMKDVSQLSNDKCYYIYTKDQLRGGLGVNKKYGSLATTFSVTNVKYKTENMSPFVFFKYHDKFLLYSVEANAFVTYNGGLTRMNIIGSNAINVTKNTNEYFMFSFASTGGVVNINTNPGLAINNWGTTSSQFDEGNQFIIEIAGDFDPSVMVALINESETVSDEDEEHYAQTPIQSVSELVNGQVYTAVTNRAAWYVPESGTQLESTKLPIWDKWSCKNTGQQFAFILHDGKYYIYNVGEQKILNGITDNSPNHGELVTDNCQPVTISGTGNLQYPLFFSYGASYNVNINSCGEVVIDTWTTLDDGNMVALRPVQGVTLSESDLRRIIRYIDGSIPGDVNGDGDVNGADIVAVINYVLNDSKTEGDVNGDGEVNGADIVAVINYVLSYTSDAVRQQTYYAHRAPARPTDTSDRLYANTVTDGITVGLTNETDFTAFQFILQLPEDCTLENVIADGLRLDNHVLQFRRMADGRYFVLGYNLDNENIAGHDGALLRLQLAGNICEGASVTDVMFFTPDAKTHRLAGLHIDLVTGLTSLENATEDATGNIYDMQGRVVMTSGQYAKQKNFLPTGIYIRNGRKFVVK